MLGSPPGEVGDVIPAPAQCPCCGSMKLSKQGEDITETLEVIPRQWKIIPSITTDEMKFTNPRTPAGVTLEFVWKRAK